MLFVHLGNFWDLLFPPMKHNTLHVVVIFVQCVYMDLYSDFFLMGAQLCPHDMHLCLKQKNVLPSHLCFVLLTILFFFFSLYQSSSVMLWQYLKCCLFYLLSKFLYLD